MLFPALKPEIFNFDRRQFLKLAGAAGAGLAGAAMLDVDNALATGLCERIYDLQGADAIALPPEHLYYFIDGRHVEISVDIQLSNLKSRANLSLFINLKQTEARFVETVLLIGPTGETLGARYFDASDRISTGEPPYVLFENIELDHRQEYKVYYQVREGASVKLYRYLIKSARRSTLNADLSYLPPKMLSDFQAFQGNNAGLMTSPYQFYTSNGVQKHSARGFIRSIGTDGSFRIDIDMMHPNLNSTHYMRYFIVTDAVGRLMGVREEPYVPNRQQELIPVTMLTADEAVNTWKIDASQVARIVDAPFLRIFTEDVYDALASSIIRLR